MANEEKLLNFIRSGSFKEVSELLNTGLFGLAKIPNVDCKDKEGNTPLILAAMNGKTDMVSLLLKRKASINLTNPTGFTALMGAAKYGHAETMTVLLESGADIQMEKTGEDAGWSALTFAAWQGKKEVAEILLKKGARIDSITRNGYTPLFWAVQEGHIDAAKLLVEKGADVNAQDESHFTPLMCAVKKGFAEIVRLLVEYGANVNAQTIHVGDCAAGWTPLMYAAWQGKQDVVEVLLKHGAYVNTWDEAHFSPLMCAVKYGFTEIARLLVEHGANVNAQTIRVGDCAAGWTPLWYAVLEGKQEIAKMLLKHRADANTQNEMRFTPLMWAIKYGYTEIARDLIDYGADVNAKTILSEHEPVDWTPLSYAAWLGKDQVIKVLLDAGAEVDLCSSKQWTPLMFAVLHGNDRSAELLIEKGANINHLSSDQFTPLRCAIEKGWVNLTRLLLSRSAKIDIEMEEDGAGDFTWSALFAAIKEGNAEIVAALLDCGADIEALSANRQTLLMTAVECGPFNLVQLLVERGASLNTAAEDGRTPLLFAFQGRDMDIPFYLIEHGASIDVDILFSPHPPPIIDDGIQKAAIDFFKKNIPQSWAVSSLLAAMKHGGSSLAREASLALKSPHEWTIDALRLISEQGNIPICELGVTSLAKTEDPAAANYLWELYHQFKFSPAYFHLIGAGDKRICEDVITSLFFSWKVVDSPSADSYRSLFKDFTEIIINAACGVTEYVASYSVNDFIGADEETYGHDTSKKKAAVDRLCEINTPVTCNLLHKVMRIKNMQVMNAVGYYQGGTNYKDLDFGDLREQARAELEKRGNPPYDPAVYLLEDNWRLA